MEFILVIMYEGRSADGAYFDWNHFKECLEFCRNARKDWRYVERFTSIEHIKAVMKRKKHSKAYMGVLRRMVRMYNVLQRQCDYQDYIEELEGVEIKFEHLEVRNFTPLHRNNLGIHAN